MSDADDARVRRIGEILEALRTPNLSAEDQTRLEGELDLLGLVVDPLVASGQFVVYSELEGLRDFLKHRQGSIVPDFDALQRRKAELDRRLSGGDNDLPQ